MILRRYLVFPISRNVPRLTRDMNMNYSSFHSPFFIINHKNKNKMKIKMLQKIKNNKCALMALLFVKVKTFSLKTVKFLL